MRKHFGNPLEMVRKTRFEMSGGGGEYSPSTRSLSTHWQMRDSTTSDNYFPTFFLFQKCYFTTWFGTDLFTVVERSKDITHVNFSKVYCRKFRTFANANVNGYCLHARLMTLVICMRRNSKYVLSRLILKLSKVFEIMLST